MWWGERRKREGGGRREEGVCEWRCVRGEEGTCEGIRMREKSKGNMRGREEHLRRRGDCLKGEEVLHDCLKKYCYAYLLWLLFTSWRLP